MYQKTSYPIGGNKTTETSKVLFDLGTSTSFRRLMRTSTNVYPLFWQMRRLTFQQMRRLTFQLAFLFLYIWYQEQEDLLLYWKNSKNYLKGSGVLFLESHTRLKLKPNRDPLHSILFIPRTTESPWTDEGQSTMARRPGCS